MSLCPKCLTFKMRPFKKSIVVCYRDLEELLCHKIKNIKTINADISLHFSHSHPFNVNMKITFRTNEKVQKINKFIEPIFFNGLMTISWHVQSNFGCFELACLKHQGSLKLVRRSRRFPHTFNVKIHPRLEQRWLELLHSKHGQHGNFLM